MTNQRLISDARRRARAESRETGRPYQTILDEIAHRAGRAGWSAFVLDPAEPVTVDGTDGGPATPTFDPDGRQWDDWILGTEMTGHVPAVLGILLVLAAAFAPNYVRVDAPYAKEGCVVALLLGLGLIVASLWRPGYRTVLLGALSWSAPRPMGRMRAARLVAGMMARVSLFFLVATAFTEFAPLLMTGVRADTLEGYQTDVLSHRTIRLAGPRRDTPVASYAPRGDHARLSIIIADGRLQPRPMRALFVGDRLGGRRMSEALKDSPVLRLAGSVDCASGRFALQRVEAAASYDAPAALTAAVRANGSRGAAIDRADVRLLCHADGEAL